MKTKVLLLNFFLLMVGISINGQGQGTKEGTQSAVSATVTSTQELLPLISTWAEAFNQTHPGTIINVQTSASEKSSGVLSFVSASNPLQNRKDSDWQMVVGKDVIVPVISIKNPFLTEIMKQGISPQKLALIFSDPQQMNWASLLKDGNEVPVHIYYDKSIGSTDLIAKFLDLKPDQIVGTSVENSKELVSKTGNDPLSIGFCQWSKLFQPGNESLEGDIRLMPIDINKNGKLDDFENIYDDSKSFFRGLWIGKYPRALFQEIYSVAGEKPTGLAETEFLKWVLSQGQGYLNELGYADLVMSDRQQKLELLGAGELAAIPSSIGLSKTNWFTIILGGLLVLAVLTTALLKVFRRKTSEAAVRVPSDFSLIDENSIDVCNGLYFDKSHTWAYMEKNGSVKVGIDDFLQHVTGSLTRIVMKKPGDKVAKGDSLLDIIHEGKHLNIKSPISGVIRESNKALSENASLINASPYAEGWVYAIEPSHWLKEIQLLFMADRYKTWIKSEFSRLKDFLAANLKISEQGLSPVILQDGGALQDHILADLGPEVWDDFQTKFLDTSR